MAQHLNTWGEVDREVCSKCGVMRYLNIGTVSLQTPTRSKFPVMACSCGEVTELGTGIAIPSSIALEDVHCGIRVYVRTHTDPPYRHDF